MTDYIAPRATRADIETRLNWVQEAAARLTRASAEASAAEEASTEAASRLMIDKRDLDTAHHALAEAAEGRIACHEAASLEHGKLVVTAPSFVTNVLTMTAAFAPGWTAGDPCEVDTRPLGWRPASVVGFTRPNLVIVKLSDESVAVAFDFHKVRRPQ